MQPQMTAAEIAQVELQLAGRVSLLEFGCGGSTLVAARQVQRIVSVDSDAAWLAKVGENLARAAIDFTPFHADIGAVGDWGYPADESRIRDWPRYHTQIWRHLAGSPDAVQIVTPLAAAHDSRPADSTQLCESPTRRTRAGNAGSTAESDGASSGTAGSSEMICCCNARADSSRVDKRSPASARRSRPPITTATPTSAITANHTYSRRPTHRTRRRTGSSMSR